MGVTYKTKLEISYKVLANRGVAETGHTVEFVKVVGAGHGTFLWTPEVTDLVIRFFQAWLAI